MTDTRVIELRKRPIEKQFQRLDVMLLDKKMKTLEAKLACFGLWWREELDKMEKMV